MMRHGFIRHIVFIYKNLKKGEAPSGDELLEIWWHEYIPIM